MYDILASAIQMADMAHRGQYDKLGLPYILHSLAVMNSVESVDEKIVAVLHDVLEDTEFSARALLDIGIPGEHIEYVKILTRAQGEKYSHYILRVAEDGITISVKIADLKDNLRLDRLYLHTEKDLKRISKYLLSYQFLMGELRKEAYLDMVQKYGG